MWNKVHNHCDWITHYPQIREIFMNSSNAQITRGFFKILGYPRNPWASFHFFAVTKESIHSTFFKDSRELPEFQRFFKYTLGILCNPWQFVLQWLWQWASIGGFVFLFFWELTFSLKVYIFKVAEYYWKRQLLKNKMSPFQPLTVISWNPFLRVPA